MKILITNHHLRNKAGSEIFTAGLAMELKNRGHNVFVFSFDLGDIAKKIQEKGIPITNNLLNFEKEKFDIIHVQHNTTAIIARSVFPDTPMVFMSHGILPELEQPPSIDLGISKFIAVSEEVRDNQNKKHRINENEIEIIRNFIDTNKFFCRKPIDKKPKKLLVLSNHYTDKAREVIEIACKELNIEVGHIGLPENSVENVEDYINNTDIVVTLGRGSLESMACERNVIVYDMRGGDGFIDENNFFEIRKNNFSGRRFRKKYSVKEFKNEILKYDPELGKKLRKIVEKENSMKVIINKIGKLYNEVANSKTKFISLLKKGQLYNEINFLEKFFVENEKKNHKINNLNQAIQQKDQELNNLNQAIQQKDQELNNLNRSIQQKDQQINNLNQAIQQKEREVNNLNQAIQQKEREVNNLNQAIQQKDQEIEFIKSSKFWKARNRYLKLKSFNFNSFGSLAKKGYLVFKKDGCITFSKYLYKYIIHGRDYFKNLERSNRSDYQKWIEKNENWDKEEIKKEIKNFKYKPKISIITPVYNVDPNWLDKCVESVKNQFYENWELCLHDDASTKKETVKCLKKWEKRDKRIKVSYGRNNQHISGASNGALKLATGEFIALLDNDDEFSPDALYENVKLLNKHPEADFIYSDEDKITEDDEKRVEPFFKPGWSPDLFLSMNYTCHLGAYRKSIIDEIGGFRKGYEGSQDYDLVLRFIEKTKPEKIFHIPKILYHWRKILTSTANSGKSKQYTNQSSVQALSDYLNRNNIQGDALEITPNRFRIKRKIDKNSLVSIIIPFKDRAEILKKCVSSILEKTAYENYEIILVDNQSENIKTKEYLRRIENSLKIKILHYNKPFNFSAINNFAAKKAKGEYILFLNNDTEVINKGWLSAMVEHIQRKEIGAVGAKLIYPNNTIQHAGVILLDREIIAGHAFKHLTRNDDAYFSQLNLIKNYSAVTAACLLVKKTLLEKVGGFNERDLRIAYNDVDLCLRIRELGYLIVYTPYSKLYHYESLSRGNDEDLKYANPKKYERVIAEREYIRKKWGNVLDNDPYLNANLSRRREDFSLKVG